MTGPAASRGSRPTAARHVGGSFGRDPAGLWAAVPAFRGGGARRWLVAVAAALAHVRERRLALVLLGARESCAPERTCGAVGEVANVLPTVVVRVRR